MTKSKFLKLPNGAIIRPFMIAISSPTDNGVSLLSSSSQMIGFIEVDSNKYDADKLKLLIMRLIQECVDLTRNFQQIDWESAFYSCERKVTNID
jgi:hypothetical protein